jgi:hypothetical protein
MSDDPHNNKTNTETTRQCRPTRSSELLIDMIRLVWGERCRARDDDLEPVWRSAGEHGSSGTMAEGRASAG